MNEMRYSDCIYFEWCKEKRGLGCQGCWAYHPMKDEKQQGGIPARQNTSNDEE